MSGPTYDPDDGEWITGATVQYIEEVVRTHPNDYKREFNKTYDLVNPTAAEMDTVHSQACLERQRRKLCEFVMSMARARRSGRTVPDITRETFRCACVPGGQVLLGEIGEAAGGGYDVGWVKTRVA